MSWIKRRVPEPEPEPVVPAPSLQAEQDEQRRRRRLHMPIVYDGRFDLALEVGSICLPLAVRVAAEPAPGAYFYDVAELVTAVHKSAVLKIGDLLAERDARRRTTHLTDFSERTRAVQLLVGSRVRPVCPQVDTAGLPSGKWVDSVLTIVAPLSAPLSDFLGKALPPGEVRAVSVSERVENALRGVDSAARALEKRLDGAASDRAQAGQRTSSADAVADELRRLGVTP